MEDRWVGARVYFNFGFLLLHVVLTLWWSDIKHPNTTPIDLSTRFQNLRELMMEATDAVVAVPFYFHIFQQYGTKSNPISGTVRTYMYPRFQLITNNCCTCAKYYNYMYLGPFVTGKVNVGL